MATVTTNRAVLVVEDDDMMRHSVGRVLTAAGWAVDLAADGVVGLRLVEGRGLPYRLVVTDLRMPRLDGRVLAETLAQCRPHQAVLCISGDPEGCPRVGPHDAPQILLRKPFTIQELHAAVQAAIGRAEALAERVRIAAGNGRVAQTESERVRAQAVATRHATRDLVAYARALRGV